MLQLLVIVGPTASGKSELAVRIAKKYNGEIISADSRQIYRGLDVGSARVTGIWNSTQRKAATQNSKLFIYKCIPHYCIDNVSPRRVFTAEDFKICADHAIANIARRGKLPILVGGTGFWIDTVVYGTHFPAVLPNPELRKQLEKKNIGTLSTLLKKLDARRSKAIDQKNPRRLIRAIEIATTLGRVPPLKSRKPRYRAFWLGIMPAPDVLKKRIVARVRSMIRRGLIAETKKLLARGISQKRICEFGFEYHAALDFLCRRTTEKQFLEILCRKTRQYARRQMTWWRRNPEIYWFTNPKDIKLVITCLFKK